MLTQNPLSKERKRKLRWFVAISTLPLLGVLTAFGLVPQSEIGFPDAKVELTEIALPKIDNTITISHFWRNEKVQRGDTISDLLSRLNVEDATAGSYLRNDATTDNFRKLSVGKEIQAEVSELGELLTLSFLANSGEQILITKQNGIFKTSVLPAKFERRLLVRSGVIRTNLYAAADASDMPEAAANQLYELFSGDIDFHHDLRVGDNFTAVYEMNYYNGELLKTGRILSAEFINQGHTYRAVYFDKGMQQGDYYTPEGKSVRKAFLRSPIEYSRVSSGYSNSRFHPVLNKWRSHKGVDFAAPTGTRVKSTADGVITFVGKEGGYGNVVKINHQGRYATVYGHLSRFASNLHKGQRILQGEVVGYVGMTGLTTGPHLHYEFKVNGQHQNPMKVSLPDAKPVDDTERAAFQSVSDDLVARLELLRNTNLAKLD